MLDFLGTLFFKIPFVLDFRDTLLFDTLFYFLNLFYFHAICILHITVALQDFPDVLLSDM